jgi:hypothetical protein
LLRVETINGRHVGVCSCGDWRSHLYDDPGHAEHQHKHHVWHATTPEDERRRQIGRAEAEIRAWG